MFILIFFLILVFIFTILPVLTFLLYRFLKQKGKIPEYIGLCLFITTTAGMLFIIIKIIMAPSGFGPDYETVVIKQNIGGKLVCNSLYNADIHSWEYSIDYKYINSENDTIDFHGGSYCGREWEKNEQIQKYDNWLILKTGFWHGSDRLIIKNILTGTTRIFDIDAKFIESDSLWRVGNYITRLGRCCPETIIENINGNEITLKYMLITNRSSSNKYVDKMITYKIDKETGDIKMTRIE
jgi:hypothetical protein